MVLACVYIVIWAIMEIFEMIFIVFSLAFGTYRTQLLSLFRVHKVESDARGRVPRSMMEVQPEKVRMR